MRLTESYIVEQRAMRDELDTLFTGSDNLTPSTVPSRGGPLVCGGETTTTTTTTAMAAAALPFHRSCVSSRISTPGAVQPTASRTKEAADVDDWRTGVEQADGPARWYVKRSREVCAPDSGHD